MDALEHRKTVVKLLQKPGERKEDESSKDCPSEQPSSSSDKPEPEPRSLIPLPKQCHGPGAYAWALLEQAECLEDQINFASLPVLAMQECWEEN